MAIEIKELIIRAQVDYRKSPTEEQQQAPASSNSPDEALVQACVKQVLKILKKQQQR